MFDSVSFHFVGGKVHFFTNLPFHFLPMGLYLVYVMTEAVLSLFSVVSLYAVAWLCLLLMSVIGCLHEAVVGAIVGATSRRSCVSEYWKFFTFWPGFNGHRVEYVYFYWASFLFYPRFSSKYCNAIKTVGLKCISYTGDVEGGCTFVQALSQRQKLRWSQHHKRRYLLRFSHRRHQQRPLALQVAQTVTVSYIFGCSLCCNA